MVVGGAGRCWWVGGVPSPRGIERLGMGWNQSVLFLSLSPGMARSLGVAGKPVGPGLAGVWEKERMGRGLESDGGVGQGSCSCIKCT